jgi:hypothetical protein
MVVSCTLYIGLNESVAPMDVCGLGTLPEKKDTSVYCNNGHKYDVSVY